MTQVISESEISYTLSGMLNDTFTFTHANGTKVAAQILPHKQPDGKLVLYEQWKRVRPGRSSRLLTERSFEITFEAPILFEYHLEQDGSPHNPQELIERFFKAMVGEVFKHQPRALFK
jgi:hypothetical protein